MSTKPTKKARKPFKDVFLMPDGKAEMALCIPLDKASVAALRENISRAIYKEMGPHEGNSNASDAILRALGIAPKKGRVKK